MPYRLLNGTRPAATAVAKALYQLSRSVHPVIWVGSGYRPRDRFPDHRSRDCFDLMTGPESTDTRGDYAAGKWAAELLLAWHAAKKIKLKKIIWWGQQWRPGRGWYPYQLSPHRNHVHIWLDKDSPAIELTKGDEAMPLTQSDIRGIWDFRMEGQPIHERVYYAHTRAQAALDAIRRLEQRLDALDPGAIRAAAAEGVADALENLAVTVRPK